MTALQDRIVTLDGSAGVDDVFVPLPAEFTDDSVRFPLWRKSGVFACVCLVVRSRRPESCFSLSVFCYLRVGEVRACVCVRAEFFSCPACGVVV